MNADKTKKLCIRKDIIDRNMDNDEMPKKNVGVMMTEEYISIKKEHITLIFHLD